MPRQLDGGLLPNEIVPHELGKPPYELPCLQHQRAGFQVTVWYI